MTLGAGGVWSLTTTAIPLGSQRQFRVLAEASGFQGTGFEYDTPFDVLHPTSRILYSRGSFGSTEMVLMEVDGSGKTVLTDATASPLRCLLSPDGTMAAFTTFAGELFVMKAELMNATTNVPVNVLDGSGSSVLFNAIPTWAPDGQHIAFADPTSTFR